MPKSSKNVVTTVFLALVLDLLAFTIPLPLFPRLIAWYHQREGHEPSSVLSRLLSLSRSWRAGLLELSPSTSSVGLEDEKKNWDVVLLGGLMGSLFSLCQCVISPSVGGLSDRYGRKRVLLATMMGNLLSAAIWMRSTTFVNCIRSSYLLSRVVGGLSEGNVQLSTAIISDVTTTSTRSRSLALVGIAFSICFTFGPSLGAYFASRPMPLASTDDSWNVYALPAAISLALLAVETVYLAVGLPETRGWKAKTEGNQASLDEAKVQPKEPVTRRLARLRSLGRLHGLFLLFFSGAEFTLTFLTYDLFAATNAQNGRLLSYIGILAAMLQARHVRPSLAKVGEARVATQGIASCFVGLGLLAVLPRLGPDGRLPTTVLYLGATCLAYTSATVVTGLTAAAAGCCDEEGKGVKELQRGRALGDFRSRGQLGRAIGPLLASSVYWTLGPTIAYSTLASCLVGVYLTARSQVREEADRRKAEKAQKTS